MERLRGKVIVVAGGGGIGNGLASRYAREGAAVVLGDLNGDDAVHAAESIAAEGGTIAATELDGADESSVRAAIDLAVGRFGGLDGIHVNFASFADGATGDDIVDLPLDVYDEVMAVNARGSVLCTRLAVPAMLARGGGVILYTSSGAAHVGETQRCAYAMSKAASHALMRHVAARFGPEGIRANVIAPGVVTHARFEAVIPAETIARMRDGIPVRRLGTPEDIAALGALLMSEEGRFINGQVLSVDGGKTMRC